MEDRFHRRGAEDVENCGLRISDCGVEDRRIADCGMRSGCVFPLRSLCLGGESSECLRIGEINRRGRKQERRMFSRKGAKARRGPWTRDHGTTWGRGEKIFRPLGGGRGPANSFFPLRLRAFAGVPPNPRGRLGGESSEFLRNRCGNER
jgi:hypothetical protein